MGPYETQNFTRHFSDKSQAKVFKLLLNFLPTGPPKTTLEIFEILKIEILTFILALLDYVSRAHEIEICPSSAVRPSVSQLSLNLMHGFLSNFGCCFPWAIRSDFFLNF